MMARHAASVFLRADHFADEVTYRAPGGPDVPLLGLLGEVRTTEVQLPGGQWIKQRTRTLAVNRDPAASTGGVAAVQLKAVVTAGAEAWAVESIESEDEYMIVLNLAYKGLMDGPSPKFGG
jgi:hypothetical protein